MKNLRRNAHIFMLAGALALSLLISFNVAARAIPQSSNASQPVAKTVEAAKETFERLKQLEGKWTGRSTKGWTEAITFKTIAQGSVVHESSFDAHPNETMATMYYLDGERLLLTHYCVSKTQPRLQATAFDDGGRKVTFTFLDGGSQTAALDIYQRGLKAAREHKSLASDALSPAWGEPELLMNLAWANLNRSTPDLVAAEQYARAALALVPYWHYVKDILLPQIAAAKLRRG